MSWFRKREPKPVILRGFVTLPQSELDARGWKSGLSGVTMWKLLSFSIGTADHLREVREWDEQQGRIEEWRRSLAQ
jgi:hypothetical protein